MDTGGMPLVTGIMSPYIESEKVARCVGLLKHGIGFPLASSQSDLKRDQLKEVIPHLA
jgi:hypothetical protein